MCEQETHTCQKRQIQNTCMCQKRVCCSVLQCVAMCCNVLQCVAACNTGNIHMQNKSVLQCVAVCCSVLQRVAVCCSVLQCVAVCNAKTYIRKKGFTESSPDTYAKRDINM